MMDESYKIQLVAEAIPLNNVSSFKHKLFRHAGSEAFIVGENFQMLYTVTNIGSKQFDEKVRKLSISIQWANGQSEFTAYQIKELEPGKSQTFEARWGVLAPGFARARLKEFFARLKKYKIPGHWYLPILIFPILLLCVSVLLGVLVSPELAPTLGFMGLIAGPMAGLLEETGWMGFAYPIMKGKSSAFTTAIYLGVIHGVWHIVADFLGNSLAFGGYWLPYFFGFCLHVVALRVLIVWVYSNTGSLFLAMLMHASSTGFYGIIISTTMAPEYWVIFYNVYGIVLCLAASIVALKYGRTLKVKST